jgi:hypothetical protein
MPVDGVARGKLFLEIAQGADGGDEERSGGSKLIIGQVGVVKVFGEAMDIDAKEDGFLVEVNISGCIIQGTYLIRINVLAIVAVFHGVLIA